MKQNEFLQQAFEMLTQDEGVKRTAYDDATGKVIKAPEGNVSIGVGHNLDAKPLSNSIILAILKEDVNEAMATAIEVVGPEIWDKLSANRRLALINLTFSMGGQGLKSFRRMLAAIIKSDWAGAGDELKGSLWATQVDRNQKPNQGRDDRVLRLLRDDIYEY